MQKYGKIIIGDCIIMKNKKGFTLVELIGVILVLSILLLITVPAIIEILNDSKNKKAEELAHMLELATETYVEQNRDLFPELKNVGAKAFIRVGTLIDKRLVPDDTKGIDGEEIDSFTVVASTGNDNIITYKYVNIDSDISGYANEGLKVLYDGYSPLYFNSTLLEWPDNSGNNNPAIIRNSIDPSIQQRGYIKLDGIDDYIELKNADSLKGSDGSFTIQITYAIYSDSSDGQPYFLTKGLGFYYLDVYIEADDGPVVKSMIRNANNTTNYWPTASGDRLITKNTLHTLTITVSKNGDNYDIQYYSGNTKLKMTEATGKPHPNSGTSFLIGIDYEIYTSFAKVYGFKMYNRVLTENEIKSNYLIDKARYEQ